MKKTYMLLLSLMSFLTFTSCIDDIEIDVQEGPELIGISGCITDEYKKHQIVISRTADFYSKDDIVTVSDAEVFVYDGYDTIYFKETENKGCYETTDYVAGVAGRTYNLHVGIVDEDGEHNYYAQSTMRDNVGKIDSLVVKEYSFGNIDFLKMLGLFPYFQSVADLDANYLVNIAVNDSLYHESLIKCPSLFLGGLSGLYFNGTEMVGLIGEQAAYNFPAISYYDTETGEMLTDYFIKKGDEIKMYMYRITPEFAAYISDINGNIGSNPMMGMPHNVSTNIYPAGKAVGFFEAASLVTSTVIY